MKKDFISPRVHSCCALNELLVLFDQLKQNVPLDAQNSAGIPSMHHHQEEKYKLICEHVLLKKIEGCGLKFIVEIFVW